MDNLPVSSQQTPEEIASLRTYTIICYSLYLASILFGITSLIGVIIAYVKRNDATGTIYGEHLNNLIRMFWISVIVSIIGILTFYFVIGAIILVLLSIWFICKTVIGLIRCIDGKPVSRK